MSNRYPVAAEGHRWRTEFEDREHSIMFFVKPDYDAIPYCGKPSGTVEMTYPALVGLLEAAGYQPEDSTIEAERERYAE